MKLPTFRSGLFAPELLKALLEQLPHAALLADHQGRLLAANTLLLQLSAYTWPEIERLTLQYLFPTGLNGNGQTLLQDRYGRHHAVVVSKTPLTKQHLLITCRPQAEVLAEAHHQSLVDTLLEAWEHLLNLVGEMPASYTLDQALEIWRATTAAAWIALYQPDPPILRLQAMAGEAPNPLPPMLPLPTMLEHPEEPTLWYPGHRPTADESLHRLQVAAPRQFLYTLPIAQGEHRIGWITAGYPNPPATHTPKLLRRLQQFFAAWFTRHHTLQQILAQQQQVDNLAALGRALYQATPYPIVLLNAEGQVIGLNRQAAQVLGYREEEVLFWPVDHIIVTDTSLQHHIQALILQERPQLLDETQVYRRSGHAFPARLYFVPILPKHVETSTARAALIIYDLSAEHQTETLRHRAEMGTLLANFAHEIRNPLNNISTGLEWLKISLPTDSPLHDTLRRIEGDLDRLTEMTTRLLDYARPREYRFRALQMESLLSQLIERQRPRFNKYGVTVTFEIEGHSPLPPVRGDEIALEQIFINLLNNAIDALKDLDGERLVAVRLRRVADQIEVTIADNGPGIPEELRSRIFEPFFTTRSDGHGLGLAITRSLVLTHKGNISVESFPGGTIFRVQLPIYRQESAA